MDSSVPRAELERFGLGVSNCRPVRNIVDSVQQAESLGAEVAFIAEDINCRNAFEAAALAATATSRIRLSTGVVNPYTRNPTSLAMAVATLDEISNGRASLGLGTSSPSLISDQMGISVGSSITVMRETTEVIRALLSGETVTYAGSHLHYHGAKLEAPTIQPHLPIFFAAMGPQMLHLTGRLADGVLLNVGASVEYVRWAIAQIHQGALDAGRHPSDLTIAAWMTAYVTNDLPTDLERARQWLAGVLSVPRQGELLLEHSNIPTDILPRIRQHVQAYPHGGDKARAARYIPNDVVERLTLIGTPVQVKARLAQYREAGVQIPVLGFSALKALFGARSDSREGE